MQLFKTVRGFWEYETFLKYVFEIHRNFEISDNQKLLEFKMLQFFQSSKIFEYIGRNFKCISDLWTLQNDKAQIHALMIQVGTMSQYNPN
jgi:hypothetical protein